MRWQFIDIQNERESSEHAAVISRIETWWHEFADRTVQIDALFSKKMDWDLPEWMAQHLQGINSNLMWEFGPAVRHAGHRLVITPESAHHLRPLVRTILDYAPTLEGWEFYDYRLAEELESCRMVVKGRTGYDITNFQVQAQCDEQSRVDLTYASPSLSDSSTIQAAFIATETLLGEECLNKWIGSIDVRPMPRKTGLRSFFGRGVSTLQHFMAIDRLKETVGSLIDRGRDQLPSTPHFEWIDSAEWRMWNLEPKPANDYIEQRDLFVGKSANPTQWAAAHSGGIFCSERFSRCGETFCFVKLDGSGDITDQTFADKSEIEEALNSVLKPNGLGCCIGGGTGIRYSYIDLALCNLDKGIQSVRNRLREGRISKRSWIQFFDSELASEWVGIYDDSPPPPMELESQ